MAARLMCSQYAPVMLAGMDHFERHQPATKMITSAGATLRPGRLTLPRRVLTVASAGAAAGVVWLLADPLVGVTLTVETAGGQQSVGPGAVVVAGLVAGLAAWALLAVLERTLRRPGRSWTLIAVFALALSLAGPLGSAADSTSAVVLTGLHLVVAAVLIPGLGGSARRT